MVIFAIAFNVKLEDSDERFQKFKIGIIAQVAVNVDKPDVIISVEYVPEFTHHRQWFRAWRNDWVGNGDPTIRQLMLLSGIKDQDDPTFVPITHGIEIVRKVSEVAESIIITH